jgi:hypothetical protein
LIWRDDFEPLAEKDQLFLIDPEETSVPVDANKNLLLDRGTQIIPGITVKRVNAPSTGTQIIFIEFGSERIVFAADLFPTFHHLSPTAISASAEFPERMVEAKQAFLAQVMEEGWRIVFPNEPDPDHRAISFERKNGEMHPISAPF